MIHATTTQAVDIVLAGLLLSAASSAPNMAPSSPRA
jgi:hypothetical protein